MGESGTPFRDTGLFHNPIYNGLGFVIRETMRSHNFHR